MYSYLEENVEPEWFRKRLNLVLLWIGLAFLILAGRLFWLQVFNGEKYRQLSLNNRVRIKRIKPPRGLIYDRNHKLIVDNRPSFNLNVVPEDAGSIEELLKNLGKIVDIDEKLTKKIKKAAIYTPYKPVVVASDIDRNLVGVVEANQFFLPGTYVSIEPKREYLYPEIAAHVIGYLGEVNSEFIKSRSDVPLRMGDSMGKSGLEKVYEDRLRGKFGHAQVEVDARGQVMKVMEEKLPVPGENIVLSIDLELQKYAMELLGSEAGSVVAMNPNNGEILCMASAPSFNENLFVNGMTSKQWKKLINNPQRPLMNKSIQGEYPPGSIYKIISAMAALEEGIVTESDEHHCSGKHFFGDRYFRCWNEYGHGNVNVIDALVHSCDVYFYKVGNKLGIDKLAEYAKRFGLGRKTGIEIENEAPGLVPDSAWKKKKFKTSWKGGETLSVVIGQGYNKVTPLQMASMTSVIANGGFLVKPRLVKEIKDSKGEVSVLKEENKPVDLKFHAENIQIIKKGLEDVVKLRKGTGHIAKSDLISIAGKTGTAQVVSSEKYKKSKNKKLFPHAWFASYAPTDFPEIVVIAFVENGEHGGATAGPIAKKMIEKYYLGKKK